MFKALKKALGHFAPGDPADREATHVRMAIACLIHESRRVDLEHDAQEHAAALDALAQLFAIAGEEAEALLAEAGQKAQQLSSYYPLVSAIKRDFSLEQRILLIELLWRIVYANGTLHPEEDHFVRKISHLIYVPNTQMMLARSRALLSSRTQNPASH
ncbi:MAG: tellurite resistance TerB family protein [Burkholderiales bacterium]|jgi:uncharacterized tellurite resistance protein B-like protein